MSDSLTRQVARVKKALEQAQRTAREAEVGGLHMLKIEENELLAALLTAQGMATHPIDDSTAKKWRASYQKWLREFIELNKAEMAGVRDEAAEALFRREGGESRMRGGETK